MQEKAANVGFDWDKKEDVWAKVNEELAELKVELDKGDKVKAEKEFGDYLFSLVNIARFYDINPDNALELTNKKFRSRFNYVEEHSIRQGLNLKDMTLAQMDALWDEAKRAEVE
jgi:XTP/dITP diphosphohydrolase